MAVRLRPRNAEELVADADFADCVELQTEVVSVSLIALFSLYLHLFSGSSILHFLLGSPLGYIAWF